MPKHVLLPFAKDVRDLSRIFRDLEWSEIPCHECGAAIAFPEESRKIVVEPTDTLYFCAVCRAKEGQPPISPIEAWMCQQLTEELTRLDICESN
jgi:hypothetical protein